MKTRRVSKDVSNLAGPIFWLVVCGIAFTSAIAAGGIFAIGNFRERALADSLRETRTVLTLVARHLDQRLSDFRVVHDSMLNDLLLSTGAESTSFAARISELDVYYRLKAKVDGSRDFAGLNIFGADGKLLNSSTNWPVQSRNISDRSYFKKHQTLEAPELLVELVRSRLSDGWALVFSRRIILEDGTFAGVITRAIAPKEIEEFIGSLTLTDGMSVSLMDHSGTLIARFPSREESVGIKFDPPPVDWLNSQSPVTTLVSPIDGKERIATALQLSAVPLSVIATMTTDSALAEWRQQTRFVAVIGSLSILVLVVTFASIIRQLRRQHEQAREILALKSRHLDTAVNNMSQGLLLFDSEERLVLCNNRYISLFRVSKEIVKPGCTLRELIQHRKETGSFTGDVEDSCRRFVEHLKPGRLSKAIIEAPGGRTVELLYKALPEGGWVTTLEDITERVRSEKHIAHLAHFDALTNLPNRTSFQKRLECAHLESMGNGGISLLYLDLDEFKTINDTLGHPVGDAFLKEVARRLSLELKEGDFAARLGGDEFAIVHLGCDKIDLNNQIGRIYRSLRRPIECLGHQLLADASIGIAISDATLASPERLVMMADLALYQAKAQGKRRACYFEPEMEVMLRSRRELQIGLKDAIATQQFELFYQTVVDAKSNDVVGCEALLRWNRPERGLVSPLEFIPLAEETGLINEIGNWVLNAACQAATQWSHHIKVAVNVSPTQLKDHGFPLKVAAALAKSGLSPSRLEIEVTEAIFMNNDEGAWAILQQVRSLGVAIVLDDFGTGYSSLSYLQRYPFDKLKIDKAFVHSIDGTGSSRPIVESVLHIAKALDMKTVAEGVETHSQATALRDLGCQQMQGYYYSRPLPAGKIPGILQELRQRQKFSFAKKVS